MTTVGRSLALAIFAMALVLALCASPADAQMGRVSFPPPPPSSGTPDM